MKPNLNILIRGEAFRKYMTGEGISKHLTYDIFHKNHKYNIIEDQKKALISNVIHIVKPLKKIFNINLYIIIVIKKKKYHQYIKKWLKKLNIIATIIIYNDTLENQKETFLRDYNIITNKNNALFVCRIDLFIKKKLNFNNFNIDNFYVLAPHHRINDNIYDFVNDVIMYIPANNNNLFINAIKLCTKHFHFLYKILLYNFKINKNKLKFFFNYFMQSSSYDFENNIYYMINRPEFKNQLNNKKVHVFADIPQTNTTYLFYFFIKNSIKQNLHSNKVNTNLLLKNNNSEYIKISKFNNSLISELHIPNTYKICILRDPYNRFADIFTTIITLGIYDHYFNNKNIDIYFYSIPNIHKKKNITYNYTSRLYNLNNKFKKFGIKTPSDIFKLNNNLYKKKILNNIFLLPMYKYITNESGDIIVDKIFILEKLEKQKYKQLSDFLGIDNIKLPKINKSDYKYQLTTEDKHYIREHYKKDFELYYKYLHK